MIFIVSDDEALRDNLSELLSLEGVRNIVMCESYLELRNVESEKVELIIYNNSEDPNAEAFRGHMLANDPESAIPIIFLNTDGLSETPGNKFDTYKYLHLPFESERFISTSASLIGKHF